MPADTPIETQETLTVDAQRRAADRARQRSEALHQSAQRSDDPSAYRQESARATHYQGLADMLDRAANMMETAP